jgi:hypothetical protein
MTVSIPPNFVRAQSHLENVQYAEDIFTYSTGVGDLGPVSPGDSASTVIQIEADSYFKWIKATYKAWTGAANGANLLQTHANQVVPNALVEITDSGSGRKLQNTGVPVSSVFGDGEFPAIIPLPRIFLPRSTITFTVTHIGETGTDDLNFVFELHGLKGFEG